MTKFGYSEVISVDSIGKANSIKQWISHGKPDKKTIKQAESIRVDDDKEVISEFLKSLKRVKEKEYAYLCFEVHTNDETKDIIRVNICHIRDERIVKT